MKTKNKRNIGIDACTNKPIFESELKNQKVVKKENAKAYVMKTEDLRELKKEIEGLISDE